MEGKLEVHAGKPNHVKTQGTLQQHPKLYSIAVTGCKWGRVSHRLPAVLHVLKPMRRTHKRCQSGMVERYLGLLEERAEASREY